MIRCIHQLMPPKLTLPKWMGINGRGNCSNCIPDIKNQDCPGFTPVELVTKVITIKETEDTPWPYNKHCSYCNKDSINGDDACLGHLPGVKYACCGHGKNDGYIWFKNGVYVSGNFRIDKK